MLDNLFLILKTVTFTAGECVQDYCEAEKDEEDEDSNKGEASTKSHCSKLHRCPTCRQVVAQTEVEKVLDLVRRQLRAYHISLKPGEQNTKVPTFLRKATKLYIINEQGMSFIAFNFYTLI